MKVSRRAQNPACETVSGRDATLRRTSVFHKAAFRRLVATALEGRSCLRYEGAYWAPVVAGRGFGIYRRSPDILACVQDQVEDYEYLVYGRLLRGACGRDEVLRPRTRLWRAGNGSLRTFDTPTGGGE